MVASQLGKSQRFLKLKKHNYGNRNEYYYLEEMRNDSLGFRKTNKLNSPNTDAVSSGGSIPIWVWFIVGIVIVFVIASL